MEKLKYSELQIKEILVGDMISLVQESKQRLDNLQISMEKDQKNKDLQKQYDKEYKSFLKLCNTLTNPISTKEH